MVENDWVDIYMNHEVIPKLLDILEDLETIASTVSGEYFRDRGLDKLYEALLSWKVTY